ncbi:MAG: hypothetical protein U0354_17090 [Candidatus Sericytochromatia bacterium]
MNENKVLEILDESTKELFENLLDPIRDQAIGKNTFEYVIRNYLNKIDELKSTSNLFLPVADKIEKENKDKIEKYREEIIAENLKEYIDPTTNDIHEDYLGAFIYDFFKKYEKVQRNIKINQKNILINSLFYTIFSIFDAFIGDLLHYIYKNKPELSNSIQKTFKLEEINCFNDITEIKEYIIDKEIEQLKRESYFEQFKILENKFDIKLSKFSNWAKFIEITQRRNILMHCNGVVSNQYLTLCNSVGYNTLELKPKDILEISQDYLNEAINIFKEVIFKLGQTLWRKIFPNEINEANDFLLDIMLKVFQMKIITSL